MPQPAADRNLLFGILAMQMDFITREQLVDAMQAWVFDKQKPLGEILCAQKAIDWDSRALLDALVQKHVAKHDNDVEKSLAATSSAGDVRKQLSSITDADVQASLSHVPTAPAAPVVSATDIDPYATVAPAPASRTDLAADKPSMLPSGVISSSGHRFHIIRPHAKGGLGEVFVAHDEELDREVALKEIQDRQADNPDCRTRFMLEAEITGGLEHPGIVPVYGLGAYPDGRPYYAMRFIRGDSLKEAIDRFHKASPSMAPGERALELRSLLGRLIGVCNAIAYAHSRDILHRDIKPANIMLGKFGETLVVDWGLAKPCGQPEKKGKSSEPGEGSLMPNSMNTASQTVVGAAVGTPQYMSPEQASGRLDELGPASDVYSLGATLYCILTGHSPIPDNNLGVVLQRVQRGDFPKPRAVKADVHPALEAVCLKAMALKPGDRYATARLLADDIEHWLADEPVSAWPEPWTVKARRWIGRHATLVTGAASAVVVALVALIVAAVLLTAANERERLAKEKAEQNYQMARAAVDRYHTEVSEHDLLKEPGMQPLRQRLLKAAEEYYKKFRADRRNDPNVQGELGKATFRLAQITDEIGARPEAIKLHEEAATLFETLPAAKANADFARDQAACYHHLGRLYRVTDQIGKSDEHYDKALKRWDDLLDRSPNEELLLAGRARTRMGIGNAQQTARRLDAARGTYEKSLQEWGALAKAHPQTVEYQRELAVNQNNLAMIYRSRVGKEKDATAAFRAAHAIQKTLADDWPNISKYQDDLARTSFNLAESLMPTAEAEVYFLEAASRWQTLGNQHPAVIAYQTRLAEAHMALADMLCEVDTKKAEPHAEQALALQRKLVEKHKTDPNHQGDLARGLFTFAEVCRADRQADREKEAQSAYEEALGIQEALVREKSASPRFQRDLAKSYNGLGVLHASRLRDEKAVDAYKKALANWEKLVKAHPDDQEYAIGLSRTYLNLGNMSHLTGDLKKADAWYSHAVASLDAQNLKSLDTPMVKNVLCSVHWMRADTRTQLKQHAEALPDWTRAFELARPGQKPAIQLPRAAALARVGKYAEAAAEIGPLVGKAKAGESLYRFASVYALCSGAASGRKDLADEYAAEAMKLLLSARDVGYFKSLATQKRLFADPDLEAIRERPEFRKLAEDYKVR